jgi:hypothetical protein
VGRWKETTSTSEGTLELAMNDRYYGDNAGLITVAITVEREGVIGGASRAG